MSMLLEADTMSGLTAISTMIGAAATVVIVILTYLTVRHAERSTESARQLIEAQVNVGKRDYWERRITSIQAELTRAKEGLESIVGGNAGFDERNPKVCFYWGANFKISEAQKFLDECRRRLDHLDLRFEGKQWQENTTFIEELNTNLGSMFFFLFLDSNDWAMKVAEEGKKQLLEYAESQAEGQAEMYEQIEREEAEEHGKKNPVVDPASDAAKH